MQPNIRSPEKKSEDDISYKLSIMGRTKNLTFNAASQRVLRLKVFLIYSARWRMELSVYTKLTFVGELPMLSNYLVVITAFSLIKSLLKCLPREIDCRHRIAIFNHITLSCYYGFTP
jgi:hypothetical protein